MNTAYNLLMAAQKYRIVSGTPSTIHTEPHIEGRRITVRDIHALVEERGSRPRAVAEEFDLRLADVYEALAYYHSNPEEMRAAEERHERAVKVAKDRSSL